MILDSFQFLTGESIMKDNLTEVLKDKELLEKMSKIDDQAEVAKLVVDAGAKKGFNFTVDSVLVALGQLFLPKSSELSEEDLQGVSGGMMGRDTGTAYGIGCQTKYMCSTNLCTKYKGTNC
jgi:hypothetical protein